MSRCSARRTSTGRGPGSSSPPSLHPLRCRLRTRTARSGASGAWMLRELVYVPGHDRRWALGWLAVAWIEHCCVHGPGDVQGQPVELDDEFAGFDVDCYALRPDGRKLYDSAVISRAK